LEGGAAAMEPTHPREDDDDIGAGDKGGVGGVAFPTNGGTARDAAGAGVGGVGDDSGCSGGGVRSKAGSGGDEGGCFEGVVGDGGAGDGGTADDGARDGMGGGAGDGADVGSGGAAKVSLMEVDNDEVVGCSLSGSTEKSSFIKYGVHL